MPFEYPVISADSHITEPPDCYTANIDPAYRDQAPHMVTDDKRGDAGSNRSCHRGSRPHAVTSAGNRADNIFARRNRSHRSGDRTE